MHTLLKAAVFGFIAFGVMGNTDASVTFTDDFESGNLDNWTIGGRQLGTHTANVILSDNGTLAGHLYQSGSFTEITMSRIFDFDPATIFDFDMKVNVASQSPPSSAYYGMSGVAISFLDASDAVLGSVWYLAATTNYPFTNWVNSATAVNAVSTNAWHNLSLSTGDLLAQILIDETQIAKTRMLFETYSSTWPYPTVTAELWVDNVNTVPLPAAAWLLACGLLTLLGFGGRKIPRT